MVQGCRLLSIPFPAWSAADSGEARPAEPSVPSVLWDCHDLGGEGGGSSPGHLAAGSQPLSRVRPQPPFCWFFRQGPFLPAVPEATMRCRPWELNK